MHPSQRALLNSFSYITSFHPATSLDPRTDSLAGIHCIARRTLRDALVVVNDVLVTARLPRVSALVVKVLAEAEVHTAPILEVVVRGWAGLHTATIQVEVAAGHTLGGVIGLRTVA